MFKVKFINVKMYSQWLTKEYAFSEVSALVSLLLAYVDAVIECCGKPM